ncbi:homeobox protein ATH1-like isoform X2 [Salvia splendens]|uniref:homeobox protein ATH1-like isoform X2 n=1 Tax=Salvia splendens TaxID=180675 RepID=UPI001C26CA87|nr:homeobox protein ATH1-like isoform X2 [Salvia splendens]
MSGTEDGLINMQTSETVGDHIVNGFVLPSTHTVGDAINKFAGQLTSRVATASDAFCGNIPSANGGAVSFSSFPQTSPFHGDDRFLEAIPLPNASIGSFPYTLIENHQEKVAVPAPLGFPLENMRYSASMNGLNAGGPSLETMLHGYGGLPFPPEVVRRVVGRTSLPLPAQPARSCHSREWPVMEQVGFGSHSHDSSQYSNELSLSLVTSRPSVLHGHFTTPHEQCCSNGVSSYSLPEHTSCSRKNHSLSFKTPQLPPLLSGSRFLEAMQEILSAIACYALENVEDVGVNVSFSSIGSSNGIEVDHTFVFQKQETSLEPKKKHLLSLLQMVDDQYSQCLDEIHTVTSAFHAVTELEPNLHACFALPTISFMYKNLRERISSHILAIGAHLEEGETRENKSFQACFIQKEWALQQLSKRNHQLLRPQRGLPETSVSVLRAWMFQNFLHPYPKDSEKHLLALKSGLTRNQVSNWFINARVRLWKPMIEEMCAEINRRKARKDDEEMEGNHRNQMRFETRRFTRD